LKIKEADIEHEKRMKKKKPAFLPALKLLPLLRRK